MALLPGTANVDVPTYETHHDTAEDTIAHEAVIDELPGEASFLRSVRFRLTAWFALVLIVILVSLGVTLRMILVRSIENDSNQRMLAAAAQIKDQTWVDGSVAAFRGTRDPEPKSRLRPPALDPYILSGMWFAMVDTTFQPYAFFKDPSLQTFPDPEKTLGQVDFSDVVRRQRPEVQELDVAGKPSRVLLYPFDPFGTGSVSAIVVVGQSAESIENTVSLLNQVLILIGVVGLLLAAGTGWLVAGRALSPVGKITRTADQIAQDQNDVALSKRLTVPQTGDELSQLALTFNAMLDRLEAAFNAQRRFVADASHELRTPLTAMRGNVDVLLRQLRSGKELSLADLRESLDEVHRESERMARLIDDLLTLARTDAAGLGSLVEPEIVSLDVLAREAFRTGQALAKGQHLTLEIQEPITIVGDGDRLVQVMIILLENAIRHTPSNGSIALRIDMAPATENEPGCARITVRDTGEGISADHLPHLFERFYRVEGARTRTHGGTGLGLSIALSIVRAHHGWIDVESGAGDGATFTIWIPLPGSAQDEHAIETTGSFASRIPLLGRGREPHLPSPNGESGRNDQ
ncbi:MAG: ATP-binding protein [Thermomicrobiales bacterium]